ncbi:MAG TPA: TetR/AcrR family transcriptional regulator C-terminal domain-containing protein [Patescibacteria group bacterium]|nr:TetR/AcrR family transcriptional regulator C-terminal domain-containing protein [Patescibacteria group bacterium]
MVRPKLSSQGGQEQGLERERVVREALSLLNEVGFSGLTLRRVAERLHVQAAALYWHFKDKQDLIDAMTADVILREFREHPLAETEWRPLLAEFANLNRHALTRYRDGAQLIAHAYMPQDRMLEGMEYLLTALIKQGFSAELAIASFFSIVRFTLGCVFEEQSDPRTTRPAIDKKAARAKLKQLADPYPTVSKIFSEVIATRGTGMSEWQFAAGLAILLDGIAIQLDAGL